MPTVFGMLRGSCGQFGGVIHRFVNFLPAQAGGRHGAPVRLGHGTTDVGVALHRAQAVTSFRTNTTVATTPAITRYTMLRMSEWANPSGEMPARRDGLEKLSGQPGCGVRRNPSHDGLNRKQIGKADDDGGDRRPEQKADDQTENGESHRGQEKVAECPGQVADPGTRGPCRRWHVAGMGHDERRNGGNNDENSTAPSMNVSTARNFPASRIGTSRLAHEKLAKSAEAVLTGDLGCRDPEGDDPEEHGRSVDAVYQPVRLGQLREAREAPATRGRSLGEEEDGEKGRRERQSDVAPDQKVRSPQLYPFAAECGHDHRITPRAPLSSTSPECVPVRAKYASSRLRSRSAK